MGSLRVEDDHDDLWCSTYRMHCATAPSKLNITASMLAHTADHVFLVCLRRRSDHCLLEWKSVPLAARFCSTRLYQTSVNWMKTAVDCAALWLLPPCRIVCWRFQTTHNNNKQQLICWRSFVEVVWCVQGSCRAFQRRFLGAISSYIRPHNNRGVQQFNLGRRAGAAHCLVQLVVGNVIGTRTSTDKNNL